MWIFLNIKKASRNSAILLYLVQSGKQIIYV